MLMQAGVTRHVERATPEVQVILAALAIRGVSEIREEPETLEESVTHEALPIPVGRWIREDPGGITTGGVVVFALERSC